jgi:putative transposase
MYKTQTYKIYNSEKLIKKYDKHISVCRMVYNLTKEIDDLYFKAQKKITCFDLIKQLPELKEEFKFVKEVDSTVLQATVERYFKTKDKFFADFKSGKIDKSKAKYIAKQTKNGQPINNKKLFNIGKPKWAKKDDYQTLNYKLGIRPKANGFYVPKFGYLKVFNFKQYQGEKLKTFSITKKADGLYLNVQIEVENTKFISKNENQVGIDMGIKFFYTTSDGKFKDNPKHLFKVQNKLRVAQKALSRKYVKNAKKQSNNYEKAKLKVAKIHKKVTDCRKDFLHKESTYLAKTYSTVYCENLNISGMIQSRLAKHIADVSWSTFFNLLEYKTNVVKVNPAYTSQKCNKCGHTCKENRKTQSIFECISCLHMENADLNGSKNILELGVSSVKRQRETLVCA